MTDSIDRRENHHSHSDLYGTGGFLVTAPPGWGDTHAEVISKMRDDRKEPTRFQRRTAQALYECYRKSTSARRFVALSASTGSAKTLSAAALMVYLARQGKAVAYVAPELGNVQEMLDNLHRLGGSWLKPNMVAAYTSIHSDKPNQNAVRDQAAKGVVASAHYTEEEFRNARITITTHKRWQRELETGEDLGVLLHASEGSRELVIVDEEPQLSEGWTAQPEDIRELLSFLSDTGLKSEARAHGFVDTHSARDALVRIEQCMADVKDKGGASLRNADLVTDEDAEALQVLTYEDLGKRLSLHPEVTRDALGNQFKSTLEFLRAAAGGRVFYAHSEFDHAGYFHAYAYGVKSRGRHVVLDGTADINGLYAIGQHVEVIPSESADYSNVSLVHVTPPKKFAGRMRKTGLLAKGAEIKDYLRWFLGFMVEHTQPGEKVLVFARKALVDSDRHKDPEFDEAPEGADATAYRVDRAVSHWKGRQIQWATMGQGRGYNRWKDCSTFFRLGDFWLSRATILAKIAATTGQKITPEELRDAALNRFNARLRAAQAAHLAVNTKQDSARMQIRELDEDGVAPACSLYLIDCDLTTLQKYRARMYPKAPEYAVVDLRGPEVPREGTGRKSGEPAHEGGAKRLAHALLSTDRHELSMKDVAELAKISDNHAPRTLSAQSVVEAMEARGWTFTTLKELGRPGKGKLLVR